jgi:hypothetical protein
MRPRAIGCVGGLTRGRTDTRQLVTISGLPENIQIAIAMLTQRLAEVRFFLVWQLLR